MTRSEIRKYIESKLIPPYKLMMGNGLATPSGIYFWDDNFDAVAILIGRYDNGNVTCLSISSLEQLKAKDDTELKKLLDARFAQVMRTWELILESINDPTA